MLIGVTGPICSGKGKVAEFFRSKGFSHHSFSAEIRQIAKERKIEVNRESLGKLGKALRDESNSISVLGRRVLHSIFEDMKHGKKDFVVEGIRDVDEIKLFKDAFGSRFILIGITAPQKVRFARMVKRARQGDPADFEKFKAIDDKELQGGHGQEVEACLKLVDYMVENDGTEKMLTAKLTKVLAKIRHV